MKTKIKLMITVLMKWTFSIITHLIPVKKDRVLFLSFHGRGFSDNPKAIYLAMREDVRFQNYTFVWAMRKQNMQPIDGAVVIPYFTPAYFWHLARSRYWICNCKLQNYVIKKHNQLYLQTWHGTPLKRLAHDIIVPEGTKFYRSGMNADQMKKTYDIDVQKYTYMISPNAFCTEVFQGAFQIERERLIETGYPRNDVLSHYNLKQCDQIKERLGLPQHKKILLYAPTWRDNQHTTAGYTFELKVDFCKWKEVLGDEFIVLFKPHYLIINAMQLPAEAQEFVYTIDPKEDIDELYLISDVLVTDYSSVFFDYGILQRPIYFYMYDLVEYAEELRGFYLDIHQDLPGDLYMEETKMLQDIKMQVFDYERLQRFNERFNHQEDGHAAERVIDILYRRGN